MDNPPSSHPFADLFALLSPDSLPEWKGVEELLRRLSDTEHQHLEQDARYEWLERLVNVRDLLRATEEQLVELYCDRSLTDHAEASDPAGELHDPGNAERENATIEVASQQGDDAEVDMCRSLKFVVDLAEEDVCRRLKCVLDLAEASCPAGELHDPDNAERENAVIIEVASHQADDVESEGNAEADICLKLKRVLDLAEASGQAGDLHDPENAGWKNDVIEVASHQADDVESEGNAEVDICLKLKRVLDLAEASGQAGDLHDPENAGWKNDVIEVASHQAGEVKICRSR